MTVAAGVWVLVFWEKISIKVSDKFLIFIPLEWMGTFLNKDQLTCILVLDALWLYLVYPLSSAFIIITYNCNISQVPCDFFINILHFSTCWHYFVMILLHYGLWKLLHNGNSWEVLLSFLIYLQEKIIIFLRNFPYCFLVPFGYIHMKLTPTLQMLQGLNGLLEIVGEFCYWMFVLFLFWFTVV